MDVAREPATYSIARVQAMSEESETGVIILDPQKGKNSHHTVNAHFTTYLNSSPRFLLQYVISPNRSPAQRQRLKEACREILAGYVAMHQTTRMFQYSRTTDRFTELKSLSNDCNVEYEPALNRYLRRRSEYHIRKSMRSSSTFTLGYGVWTYTAEFHIRPLTPTDKVAIEKILNEFVHGNKAFLRSCVFGSPALNCHLPENAVSGSKGMRARRILTSNKDMKGLQSDRRQKYPTWSAKVNPKCVKKFMMQFHQLELVNYELNKQMGLYSPRQCWEDVFTTRCDQDPQCTRCRKCRTRFAQGTLVIVAAQGTKDSTIVPHFGAVFRHPRYTDFSIEEWASISLEEMTIVFSQTSKQAQSAFTVLQFLRDFAWKDFPTDPATLMCYHGFGKKSICLLLGILGMETTGVPVDRHLMQAFQNLGWIDSGAKDETLASEMVEMWLPPALWARCNVVVAGLRQIWASQQHREILKDVAASLGQEHIKLVTALCQDNSANLSSVSRKEAFQLKRKGSALPASGKETTPPDPDRSRKRGRPRKLVPPQPETKEPRKRGRPRKQLEATENPKRKRGRPRKIGDSV
jgi:endonuclease III